MNGVVRNDEIASTVTTNKGEGQKVVIPCITPDRLEKRQNGRRFKEDGEPMFTLTSQDRHGILQAKRIGGIFDGETKHQAGSVWDKDGLAPKECWRLMGFKDEQFLKAEQVCSNSQLYKQAGNSIVVNVMEEIFKNLI